LWEFNEAFAVVICANGKNPRHQRKNHRVNVRSGAISLGHPIVVQGFSQKNMIWSHNIGARIETKRIWCGWHLQFLFSFL